MTAQNVMKAARFHKKGAPEVLIYEEVAKPVAGPGQILVRIEAAGVNFAEIERRRGGFYPVPMTLPFILGNEYAGVIEAIGVGVEDFVVGDRVFGLADVVTCSCYAQYVAVPAHTATPLPDDISAPDATALLVQGLTAYFLLKVGVGLRPNESVLVSAAAGGVGSLAVQLARIFGAGKVIGTAGSAEKRRLVLDLGADSAVDYTRDGWVDEVRAETGGRGVDTALFMTGGDALSEALGVLGPLARARVYGHANNEMVVLDFAALMTNGRMTMDQTIGFFNLGTHVSPLAGLSPKQAGEALRRALTEMIGYVRDGRLRISTKHQFPLAQAAEAHRLIETRQTTGKVVLLP